jgi:hypothetical protein
VKVTREQFDAAAIAAIEAGDSGGISMITDRALLAFLSALGVEVSVPERLWFTRTWADVRRGDVVRMPGQQETAAEVMELADLTWHVNDIPPEGMSPEQIEAFQRDVQYRPNEHAGEWTTRPVTLRPLAAEDPSTRHRIPNVNPDAPVDIRCTHAELNAIELLGGWAHRIGPTAPATAPYPTGGEQHG